MELTDFLGVWHLSRRITDRRAGGQDGLLEGQARLVATPEGALYHEEGTLRLGTAPPIRAERRYLWRQTPNGIAVAFPDGHPFHLFQPGGAAPIEATHLCVRDLYCVRYGFDDWPLWRATWTVTGPHKDYTLTSLYRPAKAEGPGRGSTMA